MSIPNSSFSASPPNTFPLVTVSLFSKSVSQFLFCKQGHLHDIFRFHIQVMSCDTCLSLTLSRIISRFIHVAANAFFLSNG